MWTVALSQLRARRRRYASVVLAVLIGTMFLAASFLVASTAQATLRTTLGSVYAGADLVIQPEDDPETSADASGPPPGQRLAALAGTPETPGALARLDDVAEAWAPTPGFAEAAAPGGGTPRPAAVIPAPAHPDLLGVRAVAGALPDPADARGVAVDEETARALGVGVGDELPLTGEPTRAPVRATVTGLTSVSPDPMLSSQAQVWASRPVAQDLAPDGQVPYTTAVLLRLAPGADREAVAEAAARALHDDGVPAAVQTPDQAVRDQLASLSGGTDLLGWVLGGFALLALVVTALVIANTFQVLVAQRTRELALLRAVGAEARQVRGAVLLEAVATGLTGAVAGVVLAVGLTAAVVAVARGALGADALTLGVDWLPLAGAVALGTAVAAVAALGPARAATRVAPVQALRPVDEAPVRSRVGLVRAGLGLLLAVGGAALMWWGAWGSAFAAALGGGVLSFLGVLLLARLFVPGAVRAAAVLARPAGVPGRLAGLNAVRHRRRTAATASALLIGTTLVALVLTGGRTAQTRLDALLDEEYPVDLVVSVPAGGDLAAATRALGAVDGVGSVAAASPVGATVNGSPAYAVEADALRSVVAALPDGQDRALGDGASVLVPAWAGATTEVVVDGRVSGLASVRGSGLTTGVFLTPETAEWVRRHGVAADAGTASDAAGPAAEDQAVAGLVLVAAADDVSVNRLQEMSAALTAAAGAGASIVDGGAAERAVYAQIIDALLWIVVGLLAVSVLIALIGVANTLSLSVIERTRENALLRALGLTRGGLRGMIAVEAVLVAGVAAVLGCGLGVLYGWAGSQLVLGQLVAQLGEDRALVWPEVPWAELALVVAVAAVAGLLASLAPAGRAARLSPVEGLATV